MAYSVDVRVRAQQAYLADASLRRIARETGVSKATLARWKREQRWDDLRRTQRELEHEAGELVLEMTRAARASRDPQQAYAALSAAELAGFRSRPEPAAPAPAEIAELLLGAIAQDPELGPVVRRRRKEVLAAVTRELDRMSGRTAAP